MPVNRLIKVLNVIVSVMAVIFLGLLLTSIFTSCKDKPNKPPVPQECPQMLNYPPRGISCIQCNVPKAEAQSNKIVDIIYKSCIQNPAISYLVDGSFGFNEQLMGSHIASLSSNGRKPHVVFYLTNGPAQRACSNPPYPGHGISTCPPAYRQRIQTDRALQEDLQRLASRLSNLSNQIVSAGGKVYIVPQLEDNQNLQSFNAMVSLIKPHVHPQAIIMRNPCPGCYAGNDGHIPSGVQSEEHMHQANAFYHHGGAVTNDGAEVLWPGESTTYPRRISLQDMFGSRLRAEQIGKLFLFWKASFQGLGGDTLPHPANRDYKMPTEQQAQDITRWLQ